MRILISTGILLLAAQGAPASAQSALCTTLAVDYESASKDLGDNIAAGVADNSAPRATLRAMEDANVLIRAQQTLELMKAHKCAMPNRAPTGARYMLAALECRNERLRGTKDSPKCDRKTWAPLGD
jgi:hypothetical protein